MSEGHRTFLRLKKDEFTKSNVSMQEKVKTSRRQRNQTVNNGNNCPKRYDYIQFNICGSVHHAL